MTTEARQFLESITTAGVDDLTWPSEKIRRAMEIIADDLPAAARDELVTRGIVLVPQEVAARLWPDKRPGVAWAGLCPVPEDLPELRARCGDHAWILALRTGIADWPTRMVIGAIAHELAHVYAEHGYRIGARVTQERPGGTLQVATLTYDEQEADADAIATEWGFGRFIEALRDQAKVPAQAAENSG